MQPRKKRPKQHEKTGLQKKSQKRTVFTNRRTWLSMTLLKNIGDKRRAKTYFFSYDLLRGHLFHEVPDLGTFATLNIPDNHSYFAFFSQNHLHNVKKTI